MDIALRSEFTSLHLYSFFLERYFKQTVSIVILLSFVDYSQHLALADLVAALPEASTPEVPVAPLTDINNQLPQDITNSSCPDGSEPVCETPLFMQLSTQSDCECREQPSQDEDSENQCKYFVIERFKKKQPLVYNHNSQHGESMIKWNPKSDTAPSTFTAKTLSCLDEIATHCKNPNLRIYYDKMHTSPTWVDGSWGRDDCVVKNLVEQFDLGKFDENWSLAKKYSGGIALDAECNRVNAKDVKDQICGNLQFTYLISPISLVLDQAAAKLHPTTIAKFALDPHLAPQWHRWRASAHMPLLVYDPEHKGLITDGSQLFGNWTFGGKQVSALSSQGITNNPLLSSAWENGFEALATLDANSDNKLEGKELADLGLWFDYNQDGVSQSGEVKSLHESGIVTLYTQADKLTTELADNADSHDIFATLGYQRLIEGTLSFGATVDWFSQGSASKVEALQRLQAKHLSY